MRQDHPLRAIRAMVDAVSAQLSPRFDSMYAAGRPSIPPEKLLRAKLLQMLYTIRSERLLMEEMDYNLLFRWFVGLNADDLGVGCDDLYEESRSVAASGRGEGVLGAGGGASEWPGSTSDEHFTVDGTLLEAWAGAKSFQAKEGKPGPPPDDPGNPTVDFHGEQRSNDTHESNTVPRGAIGAQGAEKESKLSYTGICWWRTATG